MPDPTPPAQESVQRAVGLLSSDLAPGPPPSASRIHLKAWQTLFTDRHAF